MPRRRTRGVPGIQTSAPKEVTLVIAAILWLLGVADLLLGAVTLPDNLGLYALVGAGLLLIIASLVDGL